MNEERDLEAGDFSSWLGEMQGALRGERESEVPCGGCTACCTSSQFVHIGPEENDSLAHIPAELLFPAPRLPPGHVLLGYDEHGHCPMLIDDQCSIYEHRPKTCRTYDCRIFPAAGVSIDDDDKALIERRARRWRFNFPTEADRIQHEAVRAAATFVNEHKDDLPDGAAPTNATGLAILAIEVHRAFLRRDDATDQTRVVVPDPDAVRVEVMRRIRLPNPTSAPVRRGSRFRPN
jgi:Fe-S-cluster containining protein